MNSCDTKRIIKKIADEEGLSEQTIRMIVISQYEATAKIMASGIPDKPETFKNICINAFCKFKILTWRFKKLKGRKAYEEEKRRRYDNKK